MKQEKIGLNEVATEFTLNLVYALAEKYNTSLKKVLDYFDSIHYRKILQFALRLRLSGIMKRRVLPPQKG